MKIGMFTDAYHPLINGIVSSIDLFTAELRRLGHEVFIFTPSHPRYEDQDPRVIRTASIPIPHAAGYRGFVPPFGARARRVFDTLDVFHAHHPFIGSFARLSARRRCRPFVFTNHTFHGATALHYDGPEAVARIAIRLYMRWFIARCDLVLAPTGAVAERIRTTNLSVPIRVVPTGIDRSVFARVQDQDERGRLRAQVREALGIAPECCVIEYVGRVARDKNLDALFRVLGGILARRRDVMLLVVGEGPDRDHFRRRAEMRWGRQVLFTGSVPYPELPGLYAAGDIFAFPSRVETQGLVIGEAMAAGLPVCAFDEGFSRAVVDPGTTGFLAADEAEMREQIEGLIDAPEEARRMGEGGMSAARCLGIDVCTGRLLEAYEACARHQLSVGRREKERSV